MPWRTTWAMAAPRVSAATVPLACRPSRPIAV
jgi:hypothetical protein